MDRTIAIQREDSFTVRIGDQPQRLTREELVRLNAEINKVLGSLLSEPMQRALALASAEFHVSIPELLGTSRIEHVARSRQVVMWLGRSVLGLNDWGTARQLDREHGTVRHGCARVQDMMDTNELFAERVQRLRRTLAAELRLEVAA